MITESKEKAIMEFLEGYNQRLTMYSVSVKYQKLL